ncbi:hypothetical protein EHQ05_08735 [Leptospira yasudae]|uniref:hypothetical protein n=1 Tax=Leptospira yasudae TaxID=2202201 RepID=UPI0010835435|nr:hypothetical protein [Leptospira yasudae]TGK27863.1 hypothetical protein EHQ05_08735 [Leptospira yasudae]TGM06988.1 hypothetical protein EHQ86_08790 [Leptospira yasudae]
MKSDALISWLLDGDVSIQYQCYRDLLNLEKESLRKRIESEGWGAKFLFYRKANGHWGKGFYQPKWTSTHYTLLELKNLCLHPKNEAIRETLSTIFENEKARDGGIYPIGTNKTSDVCLNGMVLNYSSYFKVKKENLHSIVDFLLSEKMKDGGFNCRSNRKGAVHSSLHSTLSVLEGIHEYLNNGYHYREAELKEAAKESREFILMHKLFRSDKTNEIIHPSFLKLTYPYRWYYNILRALDYFRSAGEKYDRRMDDAIEILLSKRRKDNKWKLESKHPGVTYFDMEKAGEPSRWNTLRILRVFKHFRIES